MLDQKEHSRIIADFDHICAVAGVQGKFLKESMTNWCGPHETEWVRKFHQYREEGLPGLLLEGISHPDVRCQAIAGALLRNYLDARVIPLNTLVDLVNEKEAPSPTVLIIPNLYVLALGKSLPAWRVQTIYDLLLERATKNKPTVVYVESMQSIAGVYGKPFADFLGSFRLVKDPTS